MSKAKILFRIARGALTPLDDVAVDLLRDRGYRVGDVVSAELRKPRNPAFNRLAHVLGRLLTENLEQFEHLKPHEALKRLQIEGDIGCEVMALNMPGIGPVQYRLPKSLSFSSMDEQEFTQIYDAMCAFIARTYWPDLTPEQVEEMAQLMMQAA